MQSIIIRAEGEAKSAELIGEAVRSNKGFLQLRRLEAARDIASLLSTSGNKVMLDSASLLLNGEPHVSQDRYSPHVCVWLTLSPVLDIVTGEDPTDKSKPYKK